MKYITLLIVAIVLVNSVFAKTFEQNFSSDSYNAAKESQSYIKFEMTSYKARIIPVSFDGYVKKFFVKGNLEDEALSSVAVEFFIKELDTDSEGRNEKMHTYCLGESEFRKVEVKLEQMIKIGQGNTEVEAKTLIRGVWHNTKLKITAGQVDRQLTLEGSMQLDREKLLIPDPSIVIASVDNLIEVKFHMIIKLE